jgi:thioredoxin 1
VSSRLKYTIDLGAAGEKAKPKVKNVLFDGEPIHLTRIFTVAITDSLAKGGYGFSWFRTAEKVVQEEFASQLQDLCLQYCKAKSSDPSFYPANPSMGRISILKGVCAFIKDRFVKEVHSKAGLDLLLKSSGDKLVVIHFTVDWCAPCRVITPVFNFLAEEFKNAVFVRVSYIFFFLIYSHELPSYCFFLQVFIDVDEEISRAFNIHCMPTFQFYKASKYISVLEGGNEGRMKEIITSLV